MGHQAQQQAQHDEDEEQAGDVEADHEPGKALERVEAGRADHGGHRAERADRGQPHDHRQDLEDQSLEDRHHPDDRLAPLAQRLHREADQQRDQQGLQHLLGGQRAEQRLRDDAEHEVDARLRLRADLGGAGGGELLVQVEPGARVQEVADHQADGERHGRHDQEVAQREAADPADLRGPADRPDAQHDRAEDHRRDHHLDQRDEPGAQRAQRLADVREEEADRDAQHHGDQHGKVEVVAAVAAPHPRCIDGHGFPVPPVVTQDTFAPVWRFLWRRSLYPFAPDAGERSADRLTPHERAQ
nr:hypothetical protein GCM10020092_020070 [Actinoplanes digitatis]